MEQWVITNEALTKHRLWEKCQSSLYKIANRDYKKEYFQEPPIISALDLDLYERRLRAQSPQPTMDAVIAVCALGRKSPALLMVELRMDYKNGKNSSISKLCQKVIHSKELLGDDIAIVKKCYFVFEDKQAPQARYLVNRELCGTKQNEQFVIVTVDEFCNLLIDPRTLPLHDVYSSEYIHSSFQHCFNGAMFDFSQWNTQLNFWIEKIEQCRWKNMAEAKHIVEELNNIYKSVYETEYPTLSDNEQLLFEIAGETIESKINGLNQ